MKKIFLLLFSCIYLYSNQTLPLFGNIYKPPKIWSVNGNHYGILIDILKELENELNIKFDLQTYPWARTYKSALKKKGGIIGISYTKERNKIFDYNKIPLFYDDMVLVVKKGNEFKFDSIEDLEGKKIGYCRDCSFGEIFEKAKKYFIPVETDDGREQRLKMVLVGKIDAALIGPGIYGLQQVCKDMPQFKYEDFTILKKPLVSDPNYIAFHKALNKQQLLDKIDNILQKKLKDKAIQKIIKKHLSKNKQ